MDFEICWIAFKRAKAKAASFLKDVVQKWHDIRSLFKERRNSLGFLMGGVVCMEGREESFMVIFKDIKKQSMSPKQREKTILKLETDSQEIWMLEFLNRELECVILELTVPKEGLTKDIVKEKGKSQITLGFVGLNA